MHCMYLNMLECLANEYCNLKRYWNSNNASVSGRLCIKNAMENSIILLTISKYKIHIKCIDCQLHWPLQTTLHSNTLLDSFVKFIVNDSLYSYMCLVFFLCKFLSLFFLLSTEQRQSIHLYATIRFDKFKCIHWKT